MTDKAFILDDIDDLVVVVPAVIVDTTPSSPGLISTMAPPSKAVAVIAASKEKAPNVRLYGQVLTRQQAKEIAQITKAINTRLEASYIETGLDLLKVKQILEHGQFGKWIEAEFPFGVRTAQNMMNAASLTNEYATVSLLPPGVVYQLAAPGTPEPAVKAIVERLKNQDVPSRKEVLDLIATEKEKIENDLAAAKKARQTTERQEKKESLKTRVKEHEKAEQEREKADAPAREVAAQQRDRQEKAEQTKREQDEKEIKQAATDAIEMLKTSLGSDLPKFLVLVKKAGYEFDRALIAA